MVQVASVRRRSWAGPAWLLIIAAGMLIALAFGNTIVLLTMLAATALAGSLVLRGSSPVQATASAGAVGALRTQRGVRMADGTPRQALLVPAAAVDGYQTVLTIDGYALVNPEGRVVYALNRELYDEKSEPVVVTILGG